MPPSAQGPVLSGRCLSPILVYRAGCEHEAFPVAALLDTGALKSAISERLARLLNLPVVGSSIIMTPGGVSQGPIEVPTFAAEIEFLQPSLDAGAARKLSGWRLDQMGSPMVCGELLIGMDIIGHATIIVTGGMWTLEFQQ